MFVSFNMLNSSFKSQVAQQNPAFAAGAGSGAGEPKKQVILRGGVGGATVPVTTAKPAPKPAVVAAPVAKTPAVGTKPRVKSAAEAAEDAEIDELLNKRVIRGRHGQHDGIRRARR